MRSTQEVHSHGHVLRALVQRAVASDRRPPSTLVLQIGAGLLLVFVALASLGVSIPGWGWTLILSAMASIFGVALAYSSWQKRRAFHNIEQAHQWCRLMDVPATSENLERCLSSRNCPEPVRVIGLVELGHICLSAGQSLDAEKAFEAALKHSHRLGPDWLWRAEVGLAEAKLRCEQLTDANTTIKRLSQRELPACWRSRVHLVTCLQGLHMGRAQDVVARSNELWHEFRQHLGVEAGYGYGLLAVALDRCGQAAKALKFWSDATLLIRPERLVQRYPELRPLALKYGASEWPW